MKKSRRLPPLNALRAFEAAGRHLSFTRAADELHVSSGAVGHQIKVLEQYFGVALFKRLNRALVLTEDGELLLPGVQDAFNRLADSIESFQQRQTDRPLTISVEPAFGAKWLLPRIERFRLHHPGIEIRIDPTVLVVDLRRGDIDVAIRYGDGNYPGLHTERLFAEQVIPVCSPKLMSGDRPLREPRDLCWHTLIHTDWHYHYPGVPDWRRWLMAAGLTDIRPGHSLEVRIASYAIQAAINGQGVALASDVLVAEDLAAGRLVKPFDLSFPLSLAYYLVCLESHAEQPKIALFRQWIMAEVEVTAHDLSSSAICN